MTPQEWRSRVKRDCAVFHKTAPSMLRFVTIILSIDVIDDPATAHQVPKSVIGFGQDLARCLSQSGSTRRGTRWAGSIEFDLVHPRLLGTGKANLAAALGAPSEDLPITSRLLISHCHLVMDASGHANAAALAAILRKRWPGPRRVHTTPLHDDKTVTENLSNLSGYMTKSVAKYSTAWLGRRTTFGPEYEPAWQLFVGSQISQVGYERMVVSNVVSRAYGVEPKRTRPAEVSDENKDVTSSLLPVQLIMESTEASKRTAGDEYNEITDNNQIAESNAHHDTQTTDRIIWRIEAFDSLTELQRIADACKTKSHRELPHGLQHRIHQLRRAVDGLVGLGLMNRDAERWDTEYRQLTSDLIDHLGTINPPCSRLSAATAGLLARIKARAAAQCREQPARTPTVSQLMERIRARVVENQTSRER